MPTSAALLDRAHRVVDLARRVTDHPALVHVARVGLIAYGAMHLLIGFLAAQLAWGVQGAACGRRTSAPTAWPRPPCTACSASPLCSSASA